MIGQAEITCNPRVRPPRVRAYGDDGADGYGLGADPEGLLLAGTGAHELVAKRRLGVVGFLIGQEQMISPALSCPTPGNTWPMVLITQPMALPLVFISQTILVRRPSFLMMQLA